MTLDEYGVAADLLAERGLQAAADTLRDMRRRILSQFTPSWEYESTPWLNHLWVLDGWEYASDGRVLLRVRTTATNTPPVHPLASEAAVRTLRGVASRLLDPLSEPGCFGEWRPFPQSYPRPTKWCDETTWEAWQWQPLRAAGRWLANGYVWRIRDLGGAELLDDTVTEYEGLPEDVAEAPLAFRFAGGEGLLMPLRLPTENENGASDERDV